MSSQVTIIARLKHTWTTVAMHDMDECGDILQVSYEPCIRYERIHGTVQEPLVDRLEMRCTMTSEAWPIIRDAYLGSLFSGYTSISRSEHERRAMVGRIPLAYLPDYVLQITSYSCLFCSSTKQLFCMYSRNPSTSKIHGGIDRWDR